MVKYKKKNQQRTSNDAYVMLSCVFFLLIFFIKAYVFGTHLNCIGQVDAIQMSTQNIFLYKQVDRKYLVII